MGKAALFRELGERLVESAGVRGDPEPSATPPRPLGRYDGSRRLSGACILPLAAIVPDPSQPRQQFAEDALERLAASIRKWGDVLQPVRVRWLQDQGRWMLIVGERRYRAALLAGLKQISAICIEGELSEVEVLQEQIHENTGREDISPIESAHAYQRYMQLSGCTAKDLAAELCVHPSTVSRALALLDLDCEVQQQVAEGALTPRAAAEVGRLKNPAQQRAVADKAIAEALPASDVARVVNQRSGKPTPPRSKGPVSRTFKVANGYMVTVSGKGEVSAAAIIVALEAALEQARRL